MLRLLLFSSLFLLFFGALSHQVSAQEAEPTQGFARNSIFLELGGNSILYSLNYDHKFFDHASARIGGMFLTVAANDPNTLDGRVSVILVPLIVNYLVGNGNSRLEIGGGMLLGGINADATVENEAIDEIGSGATITANLGYRLQPRNGGFLLRVGFTPVFGPGYFLPWAGLSLGATF